MAQLTIDHGRYTMMVPRFCPASGPALVSPADAMTNTAAIINKAFLIFIFVRSVGRCFNLKIPDQDGCQLRPPFRTAEAARRTDSIQCDV
jgi:hypothetical protein